MAAAGLGFQKMYLFFSPVPTENSKIAYWDFVFITLLFLYQGIPKFIRTQASVLKGGKGSSSFAGLTKFSFLFAMSTIYTIVSSFSSLRSFIFITLLRRHIFFKFYFSIFFSLFLCLLLNYSLTSRRITLRCDPTFTTRGAGQHVQTQPKNQNRY